jgi:hypothetical protein
LIQGRNSSRGLLTEALFGNPAVFPLRGDPWFCDPASRRVCHFRHGYPSTASPIGDNEVHGMRTGFHEAQWLAVSRAA